MKNTTLSLIIAAATFLALPQVELDRAEVLLILFVLYATTWAGLTALEEKRERKRKKHDKIRRKENY